MTKEDVFTVYEFDADNGQFIWKDASRKGVKGAHAGHTDKAGYTRIRLCGRYFMAHRLVWLLKTGVMPSKQIDHINGIRSDNKPLNLREVAPATNSENQRKAHWHSQTGLLGASPSYKSWKAQIKINGKNFHLGMFDSPMEAHQAYVNAKRQFHSGCTI